VGLLAKLSRAIHAIIHVKFPLCSAVNQLNERLIRVLIQSGAKVNTADNDANSPLHHAIFKYCDNKTSKSENNKQTSVINLLLELGASVNAQNNIYKTPFYLACERDISLAKLLLVKGAGLDTQLSSQDLTKPLSLAISKGNLN
jgi:ankyrin repeat protein